MKLLAITLSSLLLLSACSKKEDSAPPPSEAPKYITLPSGERVLVNPKQDISKSPLKSLGPVYQQAKACVQSICGQRPHDQFGPVLMTDQEVRSLGLGARLYSTEVAPALLRLTETKQAKDRQSNDDLKSMLDKMQTAGPLDLTKATANYVRMHYARFLLSGFKWEEDYDQQHFYATKKLKLNAAAIAKVPADKQDDVLNAVAALNTFIERTAYRTRYQYIEAFNLRSFLVLLANGRSLEETHNTFINFIKASLSEVTRSYPSIKVRFEQNFVLQKFLKKEPLNKIEHESLAKTLEGIAELYATARLTWPSLEAMSLDPNTITGDAIRQQLLGVIDRGTNAIHLKSKHDLSLEKVDKICRLNISAHIATRPSQSDLEEFENLLPKVKEAAKAVAQEVYPNASEDEIARIIDQAKFNLPKSLVGSINQVKSDAEIVNQLEAIGPYKKLIDANQNDLQNILMVIYANKKFSKQPRIDASYDDIAKFCMRYMPKGISDAAWYVDNSIFVSTMTLKNRTYTAGILAHEMSHLLSKQLSDTKNEELTGCLKERHNHRHIDKSIKDDQYLEEDRADAFGIRVLASMGLTEAASNFACMLVPDIKLRNKEGQAILGADGKPIYVNSTARQLHPMLSSSQGVHAAPTLRLINIAKTMDHMTPECEGLEAQESTRHYSLSIKNKDLQFVTPTPSVCTR